MSSIQPLGTISEFHPNSSSLVRDRKQPIFARARHHRAGLGTQAAESVVTADLKEPVMAELLTTEPKTAQAATDRSKIQTVNPATAQPGRAYEAHTIGDAQTAAAAARRAFEQWRRTSFGERAAVIRKAGELLHRRKDEFAALMTEEMGKPVDGGRAEIEKCAFQCDWFADHAEEYLADEPVDLGGGEAFVAYNPIGVVLAVMPWNFPFWQVFRFAAPALMAGNGALLKHASNVPGCALAIEQLLHEAGMPRDLFRTLLLPSSEVKALIEDANIAAVTLTGSVEAGRSVASAAGAVLKKCVLELGGADAYLVLEDADIEAAAETCAAARMVNGGQSCIAGKRFIVVRSVLDQFEPAMVEAMRGSRQERHQARANAERQGTRRHPCPGDGKYPGRCTAAAGRCNPGSARRLVPGDRAEQRPAWSAGA